MDFDKLFASLNGNVYTERGVFFKVVKIYGEYEIKKRKTKLLS